MIYAMCDCVDCRNDGLVSMLWLTVLKKDFDYDVCWWCSDCIEDNEDMVYMSELEINELQKKLMKE